MLSVLFTILICLLMLILSLKVYDLGKSIQAMKMLFDLEQLEKSISDENIKQANIEFRIFLIKNKPKDTKLLDDLRFLKQMKRRFK